MLDAATSSRHSPQGSLSEILTEPPSVIPVQPVDQENQLPVPALHSRDTYEVKKLGDRLPSEYPRTNTAKDVLPQYLGLVSQPAFEQLKKKEEIGRGGFGKVSIVQPKEAGLEAGKLQPMMVVKEECLGFRKTGRSVLSDKGSWEAQLQNRANPHFKVEDEKLVMTRKGRKHKMLMKYAGVSLRDLLHAKGSGSRLPLGVARDLIRQMLTHLNEMHADGLIHRDIKPDNILINLQGKLFIGDYGAADAAEPGFEGFRGRVGTYKYMAPEVVYRKTYSTKADVWSAGVVAVRLLLNQNPELVTELQERYREKLIFFLDEAHDELIEHINQDAELDASGKALLISMLDTDPKKRCSVLDALNSPFLQIKDEELSYPELLTRHREVYAQLAEAEQMLEDLQRGKPIKEGTDEASLQEVIEFRQKTLTKLQYLLDGFEYTQRPDQEGL